MSRAAKITDEALHDVVNRIDGRPRERDLRDELEYLMRRLGADGPSYDTIVAAGPDNSARPHHRPTDRRLTDGDALVIDVGALVDGYHSDMTRTFFVGEPSSELERLFRVVSSAQLAGLEAVRAGAEGVAVDAACRRVFEAEGVIDLYPHGTGHGVGLDIHEEPFIGSRCTTSLLAGEVVTVEPGLYRGGIGGIRIEDLVLVTPDGCQILTQYPKEMRCLP
jgi:Xaa-Pro aminopeptidase